MRQIAKTLVFDKNNELLVLRRSDTHPHYALEADFPGGEVDGNETPEQAASREIKEETGLAIPKQKLKLAYAKTLPNKQKQHLVFTAHIDQPQPDVRLSWEHDSFKWIDADQLGSTPTYTSKDTYFASVMESRSFWLRG